MTIHQTLFAMSNNIGLVGVAILLLAYLLLSTGRMPSNSMKYQLLNFFGAWLILFSLFFHWNLASFVIEAAWIVISLIGMVQCYRSK